MHMLPTTTRTFVIDPLRTRQNEARAERLIAFLREAMRGAWEGDPRYVEALRSLQRGIDRNWAVPAPFDVDSFEELLPPRRTRAVAIELVKDAIEPLRAAIATRNRPAVVRMNGKAYELIEPSGYTPRRALVAPLTAHTCFKLVQDALALHYLMHDPGRQKELAIERARYGRERTRLIQIEYCLWEQAAAFGGLADRMPYAHRLNLLIAAWHPSAHAPPGAWTICLRCGDLLYRTRRSFKTLPRCAACMKETPEQREWPAHALAPHDRGTWFLRCQYPSCEMAFTGPRHRKFCPEHTSSRLPPARRVPNGGR
jgi:hypothetical protein